MKPDRSQIRSDDELHDAILKTIGVDVPRVKVCPDHVAPFTALADAYFARHSVAVWNASRGLGGKSYLLAALAFMEGSTLGATVSVLGGSGEQSERVNQYINGFWNYENAPRELLLDDPSKRHVRLVTGNSIDALMASQASVRGPHPQRLRLDEVDVMNIKVLDAAFGQPMGKPGIPMQTVLSSTHQNPVGTMTEILDRAEKKGWPIYKWCYHETMKPIGWLDPGDVDQKRKDVTDLMWQVEYDLNTPKPEDVAFMTARVNDMFDLSIGDYIGGVRELIIVEEYDPDGTYAIGIDWAKKRDWTVVVVLRTDVSPVRMVAFQRSARMDWPVMVSDADKIIKMFPGTCFHDIGGIGDVAGDYMESDKTGVILAGKKRADILGDYIRAVEAKKIVAPMITWAYNEHKFCTTADLYGEGHLPDTVCAFALAWYAMNNGGWTY